MQIFDISPEISEETAVYPGDEPFRRTVTRSFEEGANYRLSFIHGTIHIGAHVDAPSHYNAEGAAISDRGLHYYLGRCQVISVTLPRGRRVMPADIANVGIEAPRVLFRTGSCPDRTRWSRDYNSLSPELIKDLAGRGVILVGIDTPSVDPDDSKALETHNAIFEHDMANLEGVVLDGVSDGLYTLVALPLKIRGADGSPVRAVLMRGELGRD